MIKKLVIIYFLYWEPNYVNIEDFFLILTTRAKISNADIVQ